MKKIVHKKIEKCCWDCQFVLTPEKVKLLFQDKLTRIEQHYNLTKQRERIIEDAR